VENSGTNVSGCGGGICCLNHSSPVVESTIIAFSLEGEAVYATGGCYPELVCCDVYGNAGGDWVGVIEDQYGTQGNISEGPLFCGEQNPQAPYALHSDSPCAEGNNSECGLIGASSVGCGASSSVRESRMSVSTLFLGPGVPNPSRGAVIIRYSLPEGEPAAAKLNVFDVTGRRVRTFVAPHQPSGTHEVTWDGTDAFGVPVANGVYFYDLCWQGRSSHNRLTLTR
jgi:hypothetical protein